MLQNIRVVLEGTSHPGNIGAAARALKTMGLSQWVLLSPMEFPSVVASARAAGAVDVLEAVQVVDHLPQAISGCVQVFGVSARSRHISLPLLDPREAAGKMLKQAVQGETVALLFGNERVGLSNEALQRCQFQVQIPSNPAFSSLNLAAAVQVLSYELRMAALQSHLINGVCKKAQEPLAQVDELEHFYTHLQRVLQQVAFLDPAKPMNLMPKLRRLFARTALERTELNILRGILSAVEKRG
ncbi:RNA methyltransferase [Ventosimonas gracilis]|uniref:tRNA (cytidine/uridine-2'-O-)-methyltransferase TrmJ n=1 Tax=Ventosimonas gracilis TaxID=1680762 RepID=A0A139SMH2_9GAMM|nr:RNA methyltransferase [Ventosimonas gracilis]KXU35767.1 RNA methyltransferase [Ventosimonas gracilis]